MSAWPIGDFVDFVHRNATTPNIRFIAQGNNSNPNAPADTCTLLAGAWLPVIKTDDPGTYTVNRDHVGAWNVPIPEIPEYTQADPKTQRITARGWKSLLEFLLRDNVIRPTPEVVKKCGDDWDTIRNRAGIRCY